ADRCRKLRPVPWKAAKEASPLTSCFVVITITSESSLFGSLGVGRDERNGVPRRVRFGVQRPPPDRTGPSVGRRARYFRLFERPVSRLHLSLRTHSPEPDPPGEGLPAGNDRRGSIGDDPATAGPHPIRHALSR